MNYNDLIDDYLENKFNLNSTSSIEKKIAIIGIGGAGYTICTQLKENLDTSKNVEYILVESIDMEQTLLQKTRNTDFSVIIKNKTFEESVQNKIKDKDIIFIISGLGGETGTSLCGKVAEIAKKENIFNVSIVTQPFDFEGTKRKIKSQMCIQYLEQYSDLVIKTPLQNLLQIETTEDLSFSDMFNKFSLFLIEDFKSIFSYINKNTELTYDDFKNISSFINQNK